MPEKIRRARNVALVLAAAEVLCCVLSFGFYDLRRGRVVLAICLGSCLTTAGGIYAKLKLHYWGLLAHSCWTISFMGGFYIYIIIDIFLRSNSSQS